MKKILLISSLFILFSCSPKQETIVEEKQEIKQEEIVLVVKDNEKFNKKELDQEIKQEESDNLSQKTTCPDTVSALWYTYTIQLWMDGKCWTSTNMKHWTKLAVADTMPSDTNTIEKWCYENNDTNCKNEWWLYTWAEAMWIDPIYNTSNYTWVEDRSKSVCWALWDGWSLPTDVEWTTLTNAWATWWTWNKLWGLVSALPGFRGANGGYYNQTSFAFFWSSEQSSATLAKFRSLLSDSSSVTSYSFNKNYGFSVLCIKN